MNNKTLAADFCLPNQDNEIFCLKDNRGKWIILYFYPKDSSKGCIVEALNFANNMQYFEDLGVVVIGVSPDSVKSHKSFVTKHNLPFSILSDIEHEVMEK